MWGYRPGLDGLRAVAVYLVLLYHCDVAAFGGGFVGVDVFFVLSGFLVSNVLLSERDASGRIRLGEFYARRVRRLLPAAVAVVVATSALFLLVATVVRRLPLVGDAQASLLYVANWHFLLTSNDYFAADNDPSPFLHFWSLSIEEQFYVVFPVILVLVSRRGRGWERTLAWVVAGLGVASVAAQVVWAQVDANHAYYGTDARIYQLLAGVLLALVLRRRAVSRRVGPLATLGFAVLLLLASGLLDLTPTWRGLAATACAVVVILGVTTAQRSVLTRALSRPTPVYLGTISYGTYLWHWPVILVLRQLLDAGPVTVAVLAFLLSTGLAALSSQLLETPIRRVRVPGRLAWPVLVAGLTTSVLAAVVLPGVLDSPRKPVVASADASSVIDTSREGRQAVPDDIDFASLYREVGNRRVCPATDPSACTVVKGDGPHLLLVGDSQAEMLEPMLTRLAKERDFTFSANVRPGCAWTTGLVNANLPSYGKEGCKAARDDWYDEALPRLRPDVVLLVQKPRESARWGRLLTNADGTKDTQEQRLTRAAQRTIDHLREGPWTVLVLESILTPEKLRVLDCLAGAETVGECAIRLPRQAPYTDSVYRLEAAQHDDVATASIDEVICPQGPMCLPLRDGVVVWRDREHLTVDFTQHFRDQIWAALKESGALEGFG